MAGFRRFGYVVLIGILVEVLAQGVTSAPSSTRSSVSTRTPTPKRHTNTQTPRISRTASPTRSISTRTRTARIPSRTSKATPTRNTVSRTLSTNAKATPSLTRNAAASQTRSNTANIPSRNTHSQTRSSTVNIPTPSRNIPSQTRSLAAPTPRSISTHTRSFPAPTPTPSKATGHTTPPPTPTPSKATGHTTPRSTPTLLLPPWYTDPVFTTTPTSPITATWTVITSNNTGLPFSKAIRVTTSMTSKNLYDSRMVWSTMQDCSMGDRLQVDFWFRKVSPLGSPTTVRILFETTSPPYISSFTSDLKVSDSTWTPFSFPFLAAGSYTPGKAAIKLHFAAGPQIFEFAGLSLVNKLSGTTPTVTTPTVTAPPVVTGPSGPAFPILPPWYSAPWFYGRPSTTWATVPSDTAPGLPFAKAIRITTTGTSINIYDDGLGFNTATACTSGDNMLALLWARKLSPLDGTPTVCKILFQSNGNDYATHLAADLTVTSSDWQQFAFYFTTKASYLPGDAALKFQFASGPQSFEIAGVSITDYSSDTPPRLATPTPCPRCPTVTPSPTYGPSSVMPPWSTLLKKYYKYSNGNPLTVKETTASDMSFGGALMIDSSVYGRNVWDAAVMFDTNGLISEGDNLVISFYVKKVWPLDGTTVQGIVNLQDKATYASSVFSSYPCDVNSWLLFEIPFKARNTLLPNAANVVFQIGTVPQTFAIGGLKLINYGPLPTPSTFSFPYPGRGNPNAPWRIAANARIDAIRKANLNVRVQDQSGNPMEGVTVKITMQRHAFKFGSAVQAKLLTQNSADRAQYQNVIKSLFSCAVLENDLKWTRWVSGSTEAGNSQVALDALAWMSANKISVRGHNLIWPGWGHMPSGLSYLNGTVNSTEPMQRVSANNATELSRRISEHFHSILKLTKGQVSEWDVLNEPFDNYDVMGKQDLGVKGSSNETKILPFDSVVSWFKLADSLVDPSVGLVYNEYDVLENYQTMKQEWTVALVKYIKARGGRIDTLGLQSHFQWMLNGFVDLDQRVASLAALNIPLAITEFDMSVLDTQLQGDYTGDFLTWAFSQPSINQFLLWGFWAGAHYIPSAAMYTKDWQIKPNGIIFQDLVLNKWWTKTVGTTNMDGLYSTRAFKGDYLVQVYINGALKTETKLSLLSDKEVTITLLP